MHVKTVLHGQSLDDLFVGLANFDLQAIESAPKGPKTMLTLRLDAATVAHFRAQGPGWQTRINAVLRHVYQAALRAQPAGPCAQGDNKPTL